MLKTQKTSESFWELNWIVFLFLDFEGIEKEKKWYLYSETLIICEVIIIKSCSIILHWLCI